MGVESDVQCVCCVCTIHKKNALFEVKHVSMGVESDVQCVCRVCSSGKESALFQCQHDGWGKVTSCKTGHHAGVYCYNEDEGQSHSLSIQLSLILIGSYYSLLGGGVTTNIHIGLLSFLSDS